MGKRFVDVPSAVLLEKLNEVGDLIKGRDGSYAEGVQGREVYYDFFPHNPRVAGVHIRVYTTVTRGAGSVRDCGEDAIRVVVGAMAGGKFRSLVKPRKVLRTAPARETEEERVQIFLDRLVEIIREAYREARNVPECAQCGLPMAVRERKTGGEFYGCVGFPNCRGTANKNS